MTDAGMVARMPASVKAAYAADPLLSVLVRLSDPNLGQGELGLVPDRQRARDLLRSNRITFVMLNRATASAALVAYVEHVLTLTAIATEGPRTLYLVTP